MDENSFWLNLEFRLCGEFAGVREHRFRNFWCDGFTPQDYRLENPSPRITGRCWINNRTQQDEWKFTLLLPKLFGSREEIDWESLLPPLNVTRWITFDEQRRYIELEPAVAVLDLAE